MIKTTRKIIKPFLFLVLCLGVTALIVNICYAYSKYFHNEQKCRDESGGRGNYTSVQYACKKAANGDASSPDGQNGCALWLGTATSHGFATDLTSKSKTGSIPIAFWGMCTDRPNTTSNIVVSSVKDGPSDVGITANGQLRRGVWNAPTSVGGSLDVGKFIAGIAPISESKCQIKYRRDVWVKRWYSDGKSSDSQKETITLIVSKGCPEEGNLCKLWKNDYESSSSKKESSGTTSIIVKARNSEDRFGGIGSGAWSHGDDQLVYAKPNDYVEWHSCYYPGVQKTADREVSDVNGNCVNGCTGDDKYEELSSDTCMDHQPEVGSYMALHSGYDKVYDSKEWKNGYKMINADITPYSGNWAVGNSSVRQKQDGRTIDGGNKSDVGKILVQKGQTTSPTSATITDDQPSVKVFENDCYCCGEKSGSENGCTNEDYNTYIKNNPTYEDPKDCKILKCTNSYKNEKKMAEVTDGPATDFAKVVVPYNYTNDSGVTLGSGTVYAGEYTPVVENIWMKVGAKYNSVTLDTYSTVVPDAKLKLFMYVSDTRDGGGMVLPDGKYGCDAIYNKQCTQIKNGDDDVWEVGEVKDEKEFEIGTRFNAFDASAGDYLCFISAVWPASSGEDTSTNEAGDNMWKYSKPSCKVIYKKPTFQVWGGSIYLDAGASVSYPKKYNAYNVTYNSGNTKTAFKTAAGSTRAHYFTPWAEQSLILRSGTTASIDSGAASSNQTGRTYELCEMGAWLSFANTPCTTNNIVGSGILPGIDKNDRDSILRYWMAEVGDNGNDKKNMAISKIVPSAGKKIENATTGTNIYYIYSSGNLRIKNESKIGAGKTYLIKVKKRLTIDSNILYADDYSTIEEVPKVVIRAKDVYIKCGVTEIDAVIIADNEVKTCSNTSGDDDVNNSRQFKLVGTVIADTVDLGRSYGAAAWDKGQFSASKYPYGTNGLPAEVFDYDSTMFMWEEFMSGSSETDAYTTVYQRELPPRF